MGVMMITDIPARFEPSGAEETFRSLLTLLTEQPSNTHRTMCLCRRLVVDFTCNPVCAAGGAASDEEHTRLCSVLRASDSCTTAEGMLLCSAVHAVLRVVWK